MEPPLFEGDFRPGGSPLAIPQNPYRAWLSGCLTVATQTTVKTTVNQPLNAIQLRYEAMNFACSPERAEGVPRVYAPGRHVRR